MDGAAAGTGRRRITAAECACFAQVREFEACEGAARRTGGGDSYVYEYNVHESNPNRESLVDPFDLINIHDTILSKKIKLVSKKL